MKTVSKNTIGGRIRKARADRDMTTVELARQTGVSTNYISVIERNVKKASPDLLRKISGITGVSAEWLRTGRTQPIDGTPENAARTNGRTRTSDEDIEDTMQGSALIIRVLKRKYDEAKTDGTAESDLKTIETMARMVTKLMIDDLENFMGMPLV